MYFVESYYGMQLAMIALKCKVVTRRLVPADFEVKNYFLWDQNATMSVLIYENTDCT